MPGAPGSRRRTKTDPPKAPIANTYWRGAPAKWVLWARIELKSKPIRWSLRLRWPLRDGDVEVARSRIEARREKLIAAAHYGEARRSYRDAFVAWGEHIIDQVGPETVKRYASSLRQLEPWILECHLDELDKAKMIEIVDGRRASNATVATIRRDLTALSSVIEFAIDRDWYPYEVNPALARLKRLTERRDPIVLPDHAHIERVIGEAPQMLGALLTTLLKTGARLGELVRAERSRIDHSLRQLTVIGKGNKLRVIDLDFAGGYEAVRAIPARLGCKWLFWHHDGEPFRAASKHIHELVAWVERKARAEAKAAGLATPDFRRFRAHDLRHRHAVDWLQAGRSIYALQKRLGHTSIQTTEIYLAYLTSEQQEAVKRGAAESQTESQPQRFGA